MHQKWREKSKMSFNLPRVFLLICFNLPRSIPLPSPVLFYDFQKQIALQRPTCAPGRPASGRANFGVLHSLFAVFLLFLSHAPARTPPAQRRWGSICFGYRVAQPVCGCSVYRQRRAALLFVNAPLCALARSGTGQQAPLGAR